MIKLPRAFLSHYSGDKKKVVSPVAHNLGRAAVIYDEFEFSTGDEFKRAIIKGLERSDVFVLFASKEALQRDWVKLEIAMAEQAITTQALSRVVTYIIDSDVSLSDIPDWMKETLIVRLSEPGLIALDIRRVIGERVARLTPTYFVGRQGELHQALEIIASFTDPDFRPPLIVFGLTGIGRRSVVQNIARDNLSYSKLLRVEINAGDLLPEFQLKLNAAVSPRSIADLRAYLNSQSLKSSAALVAEILSILQKVCSTGTLPVIIDHNAIASANGILRPGYQELYDAITKDGSTDAVIISNRRLYGPSGENLNCVRVTELTKAAAQSLIRIMGRDRGLTFGGEELVSLATYSRGYPPAVRFAIDEVTIRGLPHVVANQKALVNFSAELFLRQLRDDKTLTDTKGSILQLLSNYSPLPTSVIAGYCKLSAEVLAEEMGYLLDLAFVIPEGAHYRISEPLKISLVEREGPARRPS